MRKFGFCFRYVGSFDCKRAWQFWCNHLNGSSEENPKVDWYYYHDGSYSWKYQPGYKLVPASKFIKILEPYKYQTSFYIGEIICFRRSGKNYKGKIIHEYDDKFWIEQEDGANTYHSIMPRSMIFKKTPMINEDYEKELFDIIMSENTGCVKSVVREIICKFNISRKLKP